MGFINPDRARPARDNGYSACRVGRWDCAFPDRPTGEICERYDMPYFSPEGLEWLLVPAVLVACAMAFGIGANDSANSWGTSVGSNAISLRNAVLLGGFSEWLGASLLGYGVSGTIRHGVAPIDDPNCWACGYCDSKMAVNAVAMLAALIGAALFLALATFTSMPVSTTHAIVGGVVGATVVATPASCLNWGLDGGLGGIVLSWISSPLLAGLLAIGSHRVCNRLLDGPNPKQQALQMVPALYGVSTFVVMLLVLVKSKPTKQWNHGIHFLLALITGVAVAALVQVCVLPRTRKEMREAEAAAAAAASEASANRGKGNSAGLGHNPMATMEVKQSEVELLQSERQRERERNRTGGAGGGGGGGHMDMDGHGDGEDEDDEDWEEVEDDDDDEEDDDEGSDGRGPSMEEGEVHLADVGTGEAGAETGNGHANGSKRRRRRKKGKGRKKGGRNYQQAVGDDDDEDDVVEVDLGAGVVGDNNLQSIDLSSPRDIYRDQVEGGGKQKPMTEEEVAKLAFRQLLVFMAALASFVHGANDTANATGAFSAVLGAYQQGLYPDECDDKAESSALVMSTAGVFVALGVITQGHRVIRTVGSKIATIDFQRGFCIEFATVVSVIVSTGLNMPVSSTHCKIGAIFFVGLCADGCAKVSWSMLGKIALSWALTLPFAAGVAAAMVAIFRELMETEQ